MTSRFLLPSGRRPAGRDRGLRARTRTDRGLGNTCLERVVTNSFNSSQRSERPCPMNTLSPVPRGVDAPVRPSRAM